jgi:hypothetical protein
MAIRVEAGLPDLLYQLGGEIHDLSLTESADGDRITQAWAVRALDIAQRDVFRRLLKDKVDPDRLNPYTFTLTVDPNDSSRYKLPYKARQILWLKDSNDTYFDALDTSELGGSGYMFQGNGVYFTDSVSITGSLSARVICNPVPLSYGQAAANTGSTSVVLDATPNIGENVTEANSYVGCYIAMESGGAVGETRRITAFNTSTRACTVAAFSSAPAADDYYTIMMDVPAVMSEAVVRRAALILMRSDEALSTMAGPKGMQLMAADYERAYQEGRRALAQGSYGHIQQIRRGLWDPFNCLEP